LERTPDNYDQMQPSPFHVRVRALFEQEFRQLRLLRGVVAVVEEAGHVCDGFSAVCITRPWWKAPANFTDRLTHYNIQIGPNEPSPPEDASQLWPFWQFAGAPLYDGYGYVAQTREHFDSWYAALLVTGGNAEQAAPER
jgi:hypothetical protein